MIGRFRVLESVKDGAGSQGTVYKAVCEDARDGIVAAGTVVALKVMSVHDDDRRQWEALNRRTAELTGIRHENIVRYLGCFSERGSFNDIYVIVQEFLEGETLKDVLARNPSGLDVDEGIRIVDGALAGLVCVAERGVVHRDLKPGNIFVCRNGQIKLIDFEIAKADAGTTSCQKGNVCGSFDYMAPEFSEPSFCGDVQSDVFSMGVVLHEVLSGRTPYRHSRSGKGKADFDFVMRWSSENETPVRIDGGVRRILSHADEVIACALSRDRDIRYRDFAAFRTALSRIRMRSIRNGTRTYLLLRFIGKGGFGEVFKARVKETGKLVAVKHLLKASYAERFRREARIMSQLDDSCFVRLEDFFFAGGVGGSEAFLVMTFLEGMPGNSLRDAIKAAGGRPLPRGEVLLAFKRYARGLSIMHARGIFHRDIKPSNLYFPAGRPESAAIMDLGIARDVNGTATTGSVPGTLDYMPPEVVMSNNRGESGMDIYALGLCLYEALSGQTGYPRLPTGSAAYPEFFSRAREMKPPAFDAPDVAADAALSSLLRDMTEPDVSRRMKSADTVASRIQSLIDGHSPVRRPLSRHTAPLQVVPPSVAPRTEMARLSASPRKVARRIVPSQQARRAVPQTSSRREFPKPLLWTLMAVAVSAVAIGGSFALFGDRLKEKWAAHGLNAILEQINLGYDEQAERMETDWLARWKPADYGWYRLDNAQFVRLKERLASGKESVRKMRAERVLAFERAEERRTCIGKIAACRRLDGTLDEEKFGLIDRWTLPEWLEGDREVEMRLSGLDKCIVAAVTAKLPVEPVETRRARIRAAESILANTWSKRLLDAKKLEKAERAVAIVSAWCAGTVVNRCADIIVVDGEDITPGGIRVVVFKDGLPGKRTILRKGYAALSMPADLDGRRFDVGDDLFKALPVRIEVPMIESGVTCRIGGVVRRPSETFELLPGVYECVYSRADYKEQSVRFTVHANITAVVPEPGRWVRSEEYLAKRQSVEENRRKLLESPVAVTIPPLGSGVACLIDGKPQDAGTISLSPGKHSVRYERDGCEPQTGRFSVEPGQPVRLQGPTKWETQEEAAERRRKSRFDNLKESVRRKCEGLWANEPVENRQERLETAGVSVTRAIFDGVLTEAEAEKLLDEIGERKRWSVGKVVNRCHVPIFVGGRRVEADSTSILVFEKGIPEEWIASAAGSENIALIRDFDGRTFILHENDFVPLDVVVAVPALERGVFCHFEGSAVTGTIRLKPGRYSCIYRRRGYEDQLISFEVRPSTPMTLPPPGTWTAQ